MVEFQVEFLKTLEDGVRLVPDLEKLEKVDQFKVSLNVTGAAPSWTEWNSPVAHGGGLVLFSRGCLVGRLLEAVRVGSSCLCGSGETDTIYLH